MRVMLDGHCVTEEADSLREALGAASERASQQGRLILEVNADGTPLAPEALESPELHTDKITELALVSAEPRAFGLNILHESAEAIEQAMIGQVEAADLIEKGDPTSAFKSLSGSLALWDMVQQAVARTQEFAPPRDESIGAEVDQRVAELRDQLQSVRASVETQDWAALGDTLRYDLAELGGAWSDVLRRWAGGLSSPGGH
ncbi:MAG: hypothetical protein KDB18_10560 [Salinibacterium sp.]|nr:hypothetical protein [Salinibacterium sp.]